MYFIIYINRRWQIDQKSEWLQTTG